MRWLPRAEYVYNTSFHSAIKDTPFRVVYGRDPPAIRSYESGDCRVAAVAQSMEERDEFLEEIRLRLEQAQAVAKRVYDKGHRELEFKVGDWVMLRVRHRAPASLPQVSRGKLRPKFYGPYKVIAVVNKVAYRLELPSSARIHDVFHVGLLKPFKGTPPSQPPALPPMHHSVTQPMPAAAVKMRMARGIRQLEDKLLVEGGEMLCGANTMAGGPSKRSGPHA
ncbi:hypothetical protein U9M48_006470 [Paspalum notatum var. saurae]|uniref:Tf2-1-like SH3-like domain-containing protein n=1 Tax=Paspalum notatum var. saurae TaxID=547442 RepID=A0AAQ3PSA1_PASNO